MTKPLRRVLLIAYHFPPLSGSSGIQRTLRFARYLPDFGWEPIVLTANRGAYEQCSDDQLRDIPSGTRVIRAPALDAARHLAIAGRYPGFLARPDRWMSWWYSAVPAAMIAIRRFKPCAIWSSYPIATAHRIGATVAARSGLPWIADFRDPMAQDDYPTDPATWQSFSRIERTAVHAAAYSTFTTPSAADIYRKRYPEHSERIVLLENGYDEEVFAGTSESTGVPLNPGMLTLLHSGIVYPSERDPTHLFRALASLKATEPDTFARLRVRFRAPVHVELLQQLGDEHGVSAAIEIMPPVAYRDALAEMLAADGLLILQAANCNAQIPAKFYEYLRARRPVITLTDPAGDTATVARAAGLQALAPLDDAAAISALLRQFVAQPDVGTHPSEAAIAGASRKGRTERLATLLENAHRS